MDNWEQGRIHGFGDFQGRKIFQLWKNGHQIATEKETNFYTCQIAVDILNTLFKTTMLEQGHRLQVQIN